MSKCNDGERLRPAAYTRKLNSGAHHGENEDKRGIGKSERAQLAAKAVGDQEIDGDDEPPVHRGEEHRH